jgi:hypothetical protein
MYLIVIGWMYVVLMMSVAEATNANGSILGAVVTFVLYGVGPATLVVYLMGAPARNKAIKAREAQARADYLASLQSNPAAQAPSVQPDASGHAARGAEAVAVNTSVAPVGKEP